MSEEPCNPLLHEKAKETIGEKRKISMKGRAKEASQKR